MKNFPAKQWALTAMTAACLNVHAYEFQTEDGLQAMVTGVITLGTQIRTNDYSPEAYSSVVSPSVPGVAKGKLAGQNGGPDLNFKKGDAISTVLKGTVDVDLKKDRVGVFMRASAWQDFALGQQSAAYGNFPNAFHPNTALSDNGFDSSSKFNNAEMRDYYLYHSAELAEGRKLDTRLGRQVLNWGGAQLIGGGVGSAINPADLSSLNRPGAQAFDAKLPLGMISGKLAQGMAWTLEGFVAYESRGNVYPGCGTYFDTASFIASGCNMISFAPASEKANLATNTYVHRSPDISPSGNSLGLAYGFKSDALDADIKLYALNTTSAAPSYRMTVNSTTASSTGNSNYGLIYPENVQVFGASFNKKLDTETTTYGELAYRPNQVISFNASDLLSAFYGRSATSLLALRKGVTGIPVGGTFDAYDRFSVVTGSVGISKIFSKVINAESVSITGEVGFSHINDLPSADMLRFGRGTAYGAASYVGATGAPTNCTDGAGGKQCTTDGYTSSDAWGARLNASARYPDAVAGATLTPSIYLAKDIKGYSYDGTFSEGRTLIRTGLRAEWAKKYYLDVQYNLYGGGNYNVLVDRDYLSIVAGLRL